MKATPPKTSEPKLNIDDLGMDLLHELQLMKNNMNKNHSELSLKVDSNITELKPVQSSLSNLIGLPARIEKLENTFAHIVTKNTQKQKISY